VFERLSERARQVFVLADDEARRLRHGYIGTEHLLLGLIRDEGLAGRVLKSFGLEPEPVREEVVRIVGLGDEEVTAEELPVTPRVETIIELAEAEAEAAGVAVVGAEHLLLGLAREGHGVANIILRDYGGNPDEIRRRTLEFSGRGRP
jgi:ATP-dependent Clp protease ATP-binding subunit ClpC